MLNKLNKKYSQNYDVKVRSSQDLDILSEKQIEEEKKSQIADKRQVCYCLHF